MDQQMIMEFLEDLKEVVQKGEQVLHEVMQEGSFGQRGSYGMRGGGYGMRGSSYGNRGGYGNRRADMGHQIGASQQMGGGDFYNSQPPNYGQMPMGPDPRMM
jgi:hypothetical protein